LALRGPLIFTSQIISNLDAKIVGNFYPILAYKQLSFSKYE